MRRGPGVGHRRARTGAASFTATCRPTTSSSTPHAPAGEPALYLIDFDAFVAPAAGPDQAVNVAGRRHLRHRRLLPAGPRARAAAGDGSAAPYSDRYGRDILILELLLMDPGFRRTILRQRGERDEFERRRAAWRASLRI